MNRAVVAVLAAVGVLVSLLGPLGPAQAQVQALAQTVTANPADFTPHVLDGEVMAIAEVGNKIVLGGSFTQARNASNPTAISRSRILAFDKSTGVIDTAFAPSFNGTVRTLVAGPDGASVIVGGQFATMNGAAVSKLVKLSTATGARIAAFNPPAPNAIVYDAKLSGTRLFVGGGFTKMGPTSRAYLAEVNLTTGALAAGTAPAVSGVHVSGSTHVYKLDVSPDAQSMVAVGNFNAVDGQQRVQVAAWDVTPTGVTLRDWNAPGYVPACYGGFDYYIRDVDFSPDSTYFVTVGTGGYRADALCDAAARFETSGRGAAQPTWRNLTGADSLYTVAVTGSTVYVGGHQRWLNNPFAADSAGPGAVSREGIGALDPVNGVPLSWNPGRTRGRAVFDMIATTTGLWVGSDTDRIGNFEYHGRIAYFPLAGGTPVPQPAGITLPADVTLVGGNATSAAQRWLHRINAGGPSLPSQDSGPAWSGDEAADSPLRTSGSNTGAWAPVGSVDASVPAGVPSTVFDTERWDGGDAPEMSWQLPVPAGKQVEVRLYLANRCDCTATPGSRVFDVSVEGTVVVDDVDLSASPGHDVGTMRSTTVTSDGSIDIDFAHVVENPLVNAIEVIDPSVAPPPPPAPNPYLYRVNAGGPSLLSVDEGPDWTGDAGAASPFRNSGSNAAGYEAVPTLDGTVPASTPRAVFDTERWDPADGTPLQWDFPVPAGKQVQVRLYLANRCACTAAPGSRVFDVAIDGTVRLDDMDLSATAGHDVGTMRSFDVTSDGVVDIDWAHVVENPLVNGIEIVDPALLGGPGSQVTAIERGFDGTAAGAPVTVAGPSWNGVRGTVWIDGQLYTTTVGGTFTRRSHDGTTFGAPTTLPLYNLGAFASEMQSMTSLFYDRGRLYFTLSGQNALYSRGFSVQSGIVAAERSQSTTPGIDWGQVRGAFLVGGQLYWAAASTGDLHRTAWSGGPASGSDVVVSGPSVDGVDWRARAVFAVPGTAPNRAPVAAFTSSCTGTTCSFDGTGSSDPDGSVVAWQWTFPGGGTASGSTTTRPLAVGANQVTLTVTDDRGAQASATATVTTQNAAPVAVGTVSCSGLTCDFSAAGSSDPDGTVVGYAWAFGDGVTSTTAESTHTYASDAPRTATLVVTDDRGAEDSTTLAVTPSNAAPVARPLVTCDELACSFDGSTSTDADGEIDTWAWDFGDGTMGAGETTTHTYGAAGPRTVTLTVTDDLGASSSASVAVQVREGGVERVAHVATAPSNSVQTRTLQVPAAVQAGDTMVLVGSTNSGAVTLSDPAGWTRAAAASPGLMNAVVWTRTAGAGDAGSNVTTTFSGFVRAHLALTAYRGASDVDVVLAAETATTATHTTPAATAPAGALVLSFWTDKTAATTAWGTPAGQQLLSTGAGSGAGHLSWLMTDSGGGVPAGPVGGVAATADSATKQAVSATVVLTPAG